MAVMDLTVAKTRCCLLKLRPICKEQVPIYEKVLYENEDKIRTFLTPLVRVAEEADDAAASAHQEAVHVAEEADTADAMARDTKQAKQQNNKQRRAAKRQKQRR